MGVEVSGEHAGAPLSVVEGEERLVGEEVDGLEEELAIEVCGKVLDGDRDDLDVDDLCGPGIGILDLLRTVFQDNLVDSVEVVADDVSTLLLGIGKVFRGVDLLESGVPGLCQGNREAGIAAHGVRQGDAGSGGIKGKGCLQPAEDLQVSAALELDCLGHAIN